MAIEKILVIDDEKLVRDFLYETLTRHDYEVTLAENGKKALQLIQEKPFDLILSDLKLPDSTGIQILRKVKELSPSSLVVIITAYGSVENAVEAMQLGAFNYLLKPFSPDTIEAILEKANEHRRLVDENHYLRQQSSESTTSLVAQSPSMKQVLQEIDRIAPSHAHVLITGESGTGKEIIAQLIHQRSPRNQKPFIKVNCAAIPETLVESEFFGHEKGAFTGATTTHRGRFELANNGSLLLDEITEVPLSLQAKLLRAVQEQEFERVGGSRSIKVDVRIISTSNRNMQEALAQGKIREDLYYRLQILPIHLLPLRERLEDILPLATLFMNRTCQENHLEKKTLSKEAEKQLLNYGWPGNVRELSNVIERAVVLSKGPQINPQDLFLPATSKPAPSATLNDAEKQLILETLRRHDNNRTKTAKTLGISIRTLRNKLQAYANI